MPETRFTGISYTIYKASRRWTVCTHVYNVRLDQVLLHGKGVNPPATKNIDNFVSGREKSVFAQSSVPKDSNRRAL